MGLWSLGQFLQKNTRKTICIRCCFLKELRNAPVMIIQIFITAKRFMAVLLCAMHSALHLNSLKEKREKHGISGLTILEN